MPEPAVSRSGYIILRAVVVRGGTGNTARTGEKKKTKPGASSKVKVNHTTGAQRTEYFIRMFTEYKP